MVVKPGYGPCPVAETETLGSFRDCLQELAHSFKYGDSGNFLLSTRNLV
jgi:hypothetical protein